MFKLLLIAAILLFASFLYAEQEMSEIEEVILKGEVAICYTGKITTQKGGLLRVEKYSGVVRLGDKCIAKGKLCQANDYSTPYYYDLKEKLNEELDKYEEKIDAVQAKSSRENSKSNPSSKRISGYNQAIDKYEEKTSEIKEELSEIYNSYNKYSRKLSDAKAKLSQIYKIERSAEEMLN